MEYVELVALLAVLQFFFFGFLTGQARRESGLKAPATTGVDSFERMYRVQANTLETLMVYLPALFIAGKYWSPVFVAIIGLVYIIGRFIYWQSYVKEPSSRAIGFLVSMVPTLLLIVLAIIGTIRSLITS